MIKIISLWAICGLIFCGTLVSSDEIIDNSISSATSDSDSTSVPIGTISSSDPSGPYGWLNEPDCGQRLVRFPKIINGTTAKHGHYPWIVSLQLNNRHHCGGSLIRADWIVTAAHCVYRSNATRYKVKIGGYRRSWMPEPTSITVQPVLVVAHQGFSFATFADDLALIKLPYKVQFTNYIQPICFPEFHDLPDTVTTKTDKVVVSKKPRSLTPDNATVIGWGKVKQGGFSAEFLQELEVPIVDNAQCKRWYQEKARMLSIRPTQICAGLEEGGKDACQGDSGSPMLTTDPETKRSQIIGIVSAGIGCALPKLPGLYTRVSAYGRWISETIKLYENYLPVNSTSHPTTTESSASTEVPVIVLDTTTTTEVPATTTTEAPATTRYPFPVVTFPSTIKWPVDITIAPNGTVIIP